MPSPPAENTAWHALSAEEVAHRLGTDTSQGLDANEVLRRRALHGANALAAARPRPFWALVWDQLANLLMVLLLVAAAVAFVSGDHIEGFAVLAVIVINAAIGAATEWRAGQALAALRSQAAPLAWVIRAGATHEVPAAELVPGDLVVLEAGGRVPADGRLLDAQGLMLDESSLTGESSPVAKDAGAVPADTPLADRRGAAYLGTSVAAGRGRLLITAIGAATELGRIGALIDQAPQQKTPLERKLAELARGLVVAVLVLCAVIIVAGLLRGFEIAAMFGVGISLAVAAVPEGLPAVATMTLAIGTQRMARRRALIRRLPAVETLGATTVVCSDKTGTLTRNEMTACVFEVEGRRVEVTGGGYEARGEFSAGGRPLDPRADEVLALALQIGALCCDSSLDRSGPAPVVIGDPTEAALLVAAEKAGLDLDALRRALPRVREIPFSSEAQRMVTVHRTPEGRGLALVKGAPGVVVAASDFLRGRGGAEALDAAGRERLLEANRLLASRALRVLALAYKDLERPDDGDDAAAGLVFVGFVGMLDPLREEARAAVATCRDAGIRVLMITGDQAATAQEIGRQLGLDRDPKGRPLRTVHGRELAGLDEDGWRRVAAEAGVLARVSPEHKLRIVEALQAGGEVVAMTGDGVNDAPALRRADIGVAMGIKGTEVAKEASAMLVTDDNLASIVAAIEQGRIIYTNILGCVRYLLSCNLSEILVVFLAILLGWPLPLQALQVLWLNMITDTFPALALALEPSAPDVMRRPPRDPRAPLLDRRLVATLTWHGALLAAGTLLSFQLALRRHADAPDGTLHAGTVAFMTLAVVQVLHAFSARAGARNPWVWSAAAACLGLQALAVYWAPLRGLLRTTPLDLWDWALVLGCAVAPALVDAVIHLLWRLLGRGPRA